MRKEIIIHLLILGVLTILAASSSFADFLFVNKKDCTESNCMENSDLEKASLSTIGAEAN